MGQPAGERNLAHEADDSPGASALVLQRDHVEAVSRFQPALPQRCAQLVKGEPVDGWVFRVLRQVWVRRPRQPFVTPLQRRGIPTVQRQVELLLLGAKTVRGAEVEPTARPQDPNHFVQAALPALDMLEHFHRQADVHGRVGPWKGFGGSDAELHGQPAALGAPARGLDDGGLDVQSMYDVTLLSPQLALDTGAAADIRDVERPTAVRSVQGLQQAVTDPPETFDRRTVRVAVGSVCRRMCGVAIHWFLFPQPSPYDQSS